MTPERLLALFERISEAPDAISRLRQFILDLAIRGRLIERAPEDEPVSELVTAIETAKARALEFGDVKRLEVLQPIPPDEVPLSIPSTWEVRPLGWLASKLGAGSTPLGGKSVYQADGVPFLRSQNVYDDGLRTDGVARISRTVHGRMAGTHVKREDILLNITGASIGRCALVPDSLGEANVSQHVAIVRLFFPNIRKFVHLCLRSPFYQRMIDDVQVGVSREGLSMQRLRMFPMLLPPVAEQHRIVAKVDELMGLCDRLESAQADREAKRDRLAAASLHHLNNGANPEAFREHSHFYINHLPRLTTRPEQIKQLRQTILNLAVRGKLVPQDLREETASILLDKIQANKRDHLNGRESVGRRAPISRLSMDTPPVLPTSWCWARLGELATGLRYGTSLKCSYEPTDYPVLRIPNVEVGRINVEDLKFGHLPTREAEELRLRLGDILMVRSNGSLNLVGRPALVEASAVDFCYAGYLVRVRMNTDLLDAQYVVLALQSSSVRSQIEEPIRSTVGLKNVNATELSSLLIPLAPLAEQHRIVAKVDELMAICDQLETQLTTAQTERRRLLDSVLQEALTSAATQTA